METKQTKKHLEVNEERGIQNESRITQYNEGDQDFAKQLKLEVKQIDGYTFYKRGKDEFLLCTDDTGKVALFAQPRLNTNNLGVFYNIFIVDKENHEFDGISFSASDVYNRSNKIVNHLVGLYYSFDNRINFAINNLSFLYMYRMILPIEKDGGNETYASVHERLIDYFDSVQNDDNGCVYKNGGRKGIYKKQFENVFNKLKIDMNANEFQKYAFKRGWIKRRESDSNRHAMTVYDKDGKITRAYIFIMEGK